MSKFIPGMELNKRFYTEVVKPIIQSSFPSLRYSAGLIDYGSDVLGYDTAVSMDHQWGPRFSIFLSPDDIEKTGSALDSLLSERLPPLFSGFSTNYSGIKADYIRRMEKADGETVKHLIRIHTIEEFIEQHLGLRIHEKIQPQDWLFLPQQRLLTISKGQLFHDALNISKIKERLAFYPDDIWLYLMACEWNKISVEEAFIGRCGDVGDNTGSLLIAARITQSIMNLCFLQERKYAPYSKWFGTAFTELKSAKELAAILKSALGAANWKQREKHLARAYVFIAKAHNAIQITQPIEPSVSKYYGRKYNVLFANRFSEALFSRIQDTSIKSLNKIGSIDQITNTLTILEDPKLIRKTAALYQ